MLGAATETAQENVERRRRLHVVGSLQRILFRRILLAELLLAGMSALLAFLLAWLIFAPHAPYPAGFPGQSVVLYIVSSMLVISGIMIFAAVRVSQRICGPMFKIRRALQQIREGRDPGRIEIRRNDDLHELVDTLNEALRELRRRQNEPAEESPRVGAEVVAIVEQNLHKNKGASRS